MARYSFFTEEPTKPLDIEFFTPDPELYPGKVFLSYREMKENCPKLEEKMDEMQEDIFKNGGKYTPYTVRTVMPLPMFRGV